MSLTCKVANIARVAMTIKFIAYFQKGRETVSSYIHSLASISYIHPNTNVFAYLVLNQNESSFEIRPSSHIYHL